MDLAKYIFARLHEANVRSIFGVPGDFNLVALDYIEPAGLEWVGDANELNAAYAADGYGRLKGLSALVTTFGVGELSAINGIAGAYSEYVPVVHIVGAPSRTTQENGMIMHHTLGNGDFSIFKSMASQVAVATASLVDEQTAAQLVDDAIEKCWILSRPVYIWLPTDMVKAQVEGARLKQKLSLTFKDNDKEKEDYVTKVILKHLTESKSAIVLVDACAIRHRALKETEEFIKASGLPFVTSPMGKGAIDETLPGFCGVYAGNATEAETKERVESSDCVITIGNIKSDFNTAGFTYKLSQLSMIDFHSTYIRVSYSEYPGVRMNGVLKSLTAKLNGGTKLSITPGPKIEVVIPEESSETITHNWMWPALSHWLKPKDVVVTETGTSNFGIMSTKFPAKCTAITQYLWGSIGYATPAAQGAAIAAREMGLGRTILWTGDGSLQLTVQSIATMLRANIAPILFIICNNGYTIERFIHGMDAGYNDVQEMKYKDLPAAFGAKEGQSKSYVVKTKKEFTDLLKDAEFSNVSSKVLRLVEVYMPYDDAPEMLKVTSASATKSVGG